MKDSFEPHHGSYLYIKNASLKSKEIKK